MKKYLYTIAAAATVFASCSKENSVDENLNGEISLTSANSEMVISRAGTAVQSTQFVNGEEISVFINEDVSSDPSTNYTQPLTYTANGSGGLSAANTQYFPQSGKGVTIYACYPKSAANVITAAKDFTVAADQSTDAAYKASDLMLGLPATNPVNRITTAVPLTFTHQLSKATISLIAGDGLTSTDLKGTVVKLKTLKPTISFDPKTGVTGKATGTTADQTVMVATTASLTGSVVFVPQTIAADSQFIEITLATGGVLTYKLGSSTTFTSGKEYAYDITVKLTGLSVTSTISNWTSIGKVSGDAEMLPAI